MSAQSASTNKAIRRKNEDGNLWVCPPCDRPLDDWGRHELCLCTWEATRLAIRGVEKRKRIRAGADNNALTAIQTVFLRAIVDRTPMLWAVPIGMEEVLGFGLSDRDPRSWIGTYSVVVFPEVKLYFAKIFL